MNAASPKTNTVSQSYNVVLDKTQKDSNLNKKYWRNLEKYLLEYQLIPELIFTDEGFNGYIVAAVGISMGVK